MKRLIFLFSIIFFLIQCRSDDNTEFAFEMEYPNLVFDIPAGLNTIESHFFVLNGISTNKDFFFGNFREEDIRHIVPSFARITALDGNSIDYNFLFEVSVRICQADQANGCSTEIFYRDKIPNNVGSRLDLIPNEVDDLTDLLIEDDFTVEVVLKRLVSPSPTLIRSRLEMVFEARR